MHVSMFLFFLIFAFFCLSFLFLPRLLDIFKPKNGPPNEVLGVFYIVSFGGVGKGSTSRRQVGSIGFDPKLRGNLSEEVGGQGCIWGQEGACRKKLAGKGQIFGGEWPKFTPRESDYHLLQKEYRPTSIISELISRLPLPTLNF